MRDLPFRSEPLIGWPQIELSWRCRGEFVLLGLAALCVAILLSATL